MLWAAVYGLVSFVVHWKRSGGFVLQTSAAASVDAGQTGVGTASSVVDCVPASVAVLHALLQICVARMVSLLDMV